MQGLDFWLSGVPVIIPQAPGDFSEWMNDVPVVEIPYATPSCFIAWTSG